MHVPACERRRWRYLDNCQFQAKLGADLPWVECAAHGMQMVVAPGADDNYGFTRLFDGLISDMMLECPGTAACENMGIRWDETDGINQRAVCRGLDRKVPPVLPRWWIDEKSVEVGQSCMKIVAESTPRPPVHIEYVGRGCQRDRQETGIPAGIS